MDKVVTKLVALGVPGLVLLVVIAGSGLAGGAAIVAALAALGGPLGILGGLGVLGTLALVSDAVADYGVEAIFKEVVDGLRKKGKSKRQMRREIESYPITSSLKKKLLNHLGA
jgi:hypothetical protein